jgi:hypothetical protein
MMVAATSFFSRARPSKSTTRKVRGFLSLPGELRNQIYQHYFDSEFRCEIAARGSQFEKRKTRTVKLWAGAIQSNTHVLKYEPAVKSENKSVVVCISRPLGRYNLIHGLQTKWPVSLFAITLVCKQVHAETLAFLYHKTVFVFDAPNRMTNFLDIVSIPNLEHITKLQLHYTTYGCPKWTKDRIWQGKHNQSWIRACAAASRKLVGLHSLNIWIQLNDVPPHFSLRESWVLPLLQFRRLTQASKRVHDTLGSNTSTLQREGLEVVRIHFRTRLSSYTFNGNQELAKASEDLHCLFGQAISHAILGRKEKEAMAGFNTAWEVEYGMWQYHLGFSKTGW